MHRLLCDSATSMWKIELIMQQNYLKINRSTFSILQTFSYRFLAHSFLLFDSIWIINANKCIPASCCCILTFVCNAMHSIILHSVGFFFGSLIPHAAHDGVALSNDFQRINMLASTSYGMLYVTVVLVRHIYSFISLIFSFSSSWKSCFSMKQNKWICVCVCMCHHYCWLVWSYSHVHNS